MRKKGESEKDHISDEKSEKEVLDDHLDEYRLSVKKIELPMFDESDLVTWITRAEIYFEVQNTPDDVKIKLASLCMGGEVSPIAPVCRKTAKVVGAG